MFPVGQIATIVHGELLRGDGMAPSRAIHDSRLVVPGDLFVALPGRRSDGHYFLIEAFERGACAAILSEVDAVPDSARNLIIVEDPVRALQELALAWRNTLNASFIAITGSNGKSTVKSLLGHLLAQHGQTYVSPHNYNTEIGLPIALLSMPPDARFGVFELGAEKPGDIASLAAILQPSVGVLTSVGPSHLDDFGTIDAVASEKWSLVDQLPENGTAIVAGDSDALFRRIPTARTSVLTAGLARGDLRGRILKAVPHLEVRLDRHNVTLSCSLLGSHNAHNLLLAAAAANALGMPWTSIAAQSTSYEPMPHRLRPIQVEFGTVLDDTYNANPASMTAALEVLAAYAGASKAFVFGEMLGLGVDTDRFHREIANLALSLPIDTVLPLGESSVAACQAANDPRIVTLPRQDIATAVRRLAPPTVVLIKGSRALGLEALVEELQSVSPPP
jgi:UDP-N-acetylmuramoyl-tripeptide--D-alanyl-D-alanine ligase